ncbi:MAG: SDR family oxidoreductase [Bryobacteraceae bacterium]|nr:SDR family oxidoreductase [Bryobacteraceae bacterium]
MRMKDKVVVVTGGGTGIGRGISEAFAREGARVVVNYSVSRDDAEATAQAIRDSGGEAVAVQANVTVEAEAKKLLEDTVVRCGRLDVLVNNAGWSKRVPHHQLEDLTEEIWDRTLNTNLRGAFYCMRAAAPILKKNPGSSIVNIVSIAPYAGGGSSIVYAASKAGLISMTKSFARILAPEVRVNAVAPGFVRTRFAGWPKETFDEAEKASILKRLAAPEDIGAAAVFLAADALGTTGETINVDAGQTALGR